MNEDIKATFIIPREHRDENDCAEEMQLAFITCQQHSGGGLQAQWVHEDVYDQFEGLTKKDVFVLSQFEGRLFDRLQQTKCLLVGPRCLSCCLTEGAPIPSGPEPVFTVAMRGVVVTASGLTKQKKEQIKRKVHWMGGIYRTALTDETTHLISDTVLSDKYVKSVEKGIPIMNETWIEAVWKASLQLNVSGASADFNDHRLATFANLQVTTSGISKKEKQKIIKLITENGGTFSGAFQSETTDVVILSEEGVGSEKHKAALEYGKACVRAEWARRSAARGAALAVAAWAVGRGTSSPLAGHSRLPDMSLNFSRITTARPPNNFVEESRVTDASTASFKPSQDFKKEDKLTAAERDAIEELENFDMSLAAKAGPIFDGFYVVVEGAGAERAGRLLARCGGARCGGRGGARATHVLLADRRRAPHLARQLPGVPLLPLRWLLDSVRAAAALPEHQYALGPAPRTPSKAGARAEPESPMSRRNLQLLRRAAPAPAVHAPTATSATSEPAADDLVHHYLSQHADAASDPVPDRSRGDSPPAALAPELPRDLPDLPDLPDLTDDDPHLTDDDPTGELDEQIFKDVRLEVQGLDEEAVSEVAAEVRALGGRLCAGGAGGAGTHVLLPLEYDVRALRTRAEPVTVLWIRDCAAARRLLAPRYYHRPVHVSAPAALHGVVLSLSTYSGVERAFLDELAKLLGATTQLRFSRRAAGGALACTHLVCPAAAGDKYRGAARWGLPAVTAAWLLASVGGRAAEGAYLVTGAAPVQPEQEPEPGRPRTEEEEENQEDDHGARCDRDKENGMLPPPPAALSRRNSLQSRDHTPTGKGVLKDGALSPASRYIAMARLGLLADSQGTPVAPAPPPDEAALHTPSLDDALSTPNLLRLSPTTRRRLQAVRRGELPSASVRTPADPFCSPDEGAAAGLSPGARRGLRGVLRALPPPLPAPPASTPLSEIRSRYLAQFSSPAAATPPAPAARAAPPRKLLLQEHADTPPAKVARLEQLEPHEQPVPPEQHEQHSPRPPHAPVEAQLARLTAALARSGGKPRRTRDSAAPDHPPTESEAGPESQPNTVGWDDSSPADAAARPRDSSPAAPPASAPPGEVSPPREAAPPARDVRWFMLSSNVDNRAEVEAGIAALGGNVVEPGDDEAAAARVTHVLCAAPARSEKVLCSVAAGRWLLRPAYVPACRAAGRFLPEERFEWGAPGGPPGLTAAERALAAAARRWRLARQRGAPPPFRGLRALLHVAAARRPLLARLLRAGGGHALPADPPYAAADHGDHAPTLCLADARRPLREEDAAWLRERRVPVVAPVLLSALLTDEPPPDPADHCLPGHELPAE